MTDTAFSAPTTVPADVTVDVVIAVTPEVAYDAVSDVTRMGEWSPEAVGARIPGTAPLTVGDRFTGRNRSGLARWHTSCRVVAAERGRRFAFDVSFAGIAVSRWEYAFDAVDLADGPATRVVESWWDHRRGVRGRLLRESSSVLTMSRDRATHNRRTMRVTLDSLKEGLESGRA